MAETETRAVPPMTGFRLFQPRSILGLVLIGFTLAQIPPLAALWIAVAQVGRLAEQSQVAVVQAVEATQSGRLLISQITAMERSARQYLVVRDNDLLEVYRESHQGFSRSLERLRPLSLEANQKLTLERLTQLEERLYQVFAYPREKPEASEVRVAEFVQALGLARDFLSQSNAWVDREVQGLHALAGDTTALLGWLMLAVLPAVLVLAALFTTLIVRPLRRMARAIQRLGKEDFARPIVIRGPRDLELLGQRLDWLRGRLAELEQQKVRFLRQVSHELKTPLAALREGGELLADQVLGPLNDEQQEVASIMRENALRLQRLIEDLLSFNQALSRNLEFRGESLNVDELINDVVEVQRLAWKGRQLRLRLAIEPLRLIGDRDKLTTIVDNLLSNAIKFSPQGGEVTITLETVNDQVRLRVRDSGPGFHLEDRHRVFEAFYQGGAVANSYVKGSGLGLAIAKEYALAHGGRLEIVDESRSGGCVQLTLPLKRELP